MSSTAKRVTLPRLDTSSTMPTPTPKGYDSVEIRLLTAVADILRLDQQDVRLDDSFVDLGGDQRMAMALRRACMKMGMAVRAKDAMRCHTLAELQTCITPCAPQSLEPVTRNSVSITPLKLSSPARPAADSPVGLHSRKSSNASTASGQWRDVEEFLCTNKAVSHAVVVRPRAGLFDGKLLTILTLRSTSLKKSREPAIELIPENRAIFAGAHVATLKQELEGCNFPGDRPDVWVALNEMPVTDEGQIDRRRLRTWAQNVNEDIYRRVLSLDTRQIVQLPETEMERSIQHLVAWSLQLPSEQVGVNFSFTQLGGDETAAESLVARCKVDSIYLNVDEVLQSNTLARLAAIASQRGGLAHRWADDSADDLELAPIQQLYFHSRMGGDADRRERDDGNYRFNQSLLLKVCNGYDLDDITAAVTAVVGHHAMLRARFTETQSGWTQHILPDVKDSYSLSHHHIRTDDEVEAVISDAQASINIEHGPVFAARHFTTSDNQQMIYVVAHHLVVDLMSWKVIIADLEELLLNGSLLSQRSMPFPTWIQHQKNTIKGQGSLPFDVMPGDFAYWGLAGPSNTYADAAEASFTLSSELTSILQTTCNDVLRTESVDIYVAALLLSFSQTFHDRPVPVIWNQENGRATSDPNFDISDTVGWFTDLCPVKEAILGSDDFLDVLRRLKDTRRIVSSQCAGYFASKLSSNAVDDLFCYDWPLEVVFSYSDSVQRGTFDNGVFEQLAIPGRTLTSRTSDVGPDVGRIALFEINATIDQGDTKIKFLYSRASSRQDQIAAWIQNYEHLLLEAIGRLRYHDQELTLSDVPHLNINYDGLYKLNRTVVTELGIPSVRDIEAIYPATHVQQAALVSQASNAEMCHLHSIYEFMSPHGALVDTSLLCSSWQAIVARHPALRTVFTDSVTEIGLYDAVVLKKCSPNMLFIDTEMGQDPVASLLALPPVQSGLSDPRHRLTVCRGSMRTFIKLDISEALCDLLSLNTLFSELKRGYATGKPLSDLVSFSYPAYLEFLGSIDRKTSLNFWRDHLAGTSPCVFPRLSIANEERKVQTAHAELDIDQKAIAEFSRANRTNTSSILRVAWALVLRAFTGSDAVCFGYKAPGRSASVQGMRSTVGSFANVIPCKFALSLHESLSTALRLAEEQYMASLPHQHITASEIHHALGMKGYESLFNTVLSFVGDSNNSTAGEAIQFRSVLRYESPGYDLGMSVRFSGDKLAVALGHSILSEEQAENLLHTFGRAIRSILHTPNGMVTDVDLFTDRDYAHIVSWNRDADADETVACNVHDLVVMRATERPEAEAICAWDGVLTYQQLNHTATRLSRLLVDAGVSANVPVLASLDKSRLSPIAMLAVLKAGGAMVPIDAEELGHARAICEVVDAKVAIACGASAGSLSELVEKVIIVDTDLISNLPADNAQVNDDGTTAPTKPEDTACIFFTPVTSRELRGVSFTHTALSTAFLHQGPAAGINSRSRVLQLSSFNVDISISEVFTTLAHGGCICIPTAPERLRDFTGAVKRMDITWSYMTPLLSRKLQVDLLPSLKTVCFRTRSLDEDTYAAWAGKKRVVMAYGAIDVCPLGVSFLEIHGSHLLGRINRPIQGNLWVANPEDHQRLMPIGSIGELVVEGPTLGQNYSQAPGKSDCMDSMIGERKARYFKTGHKVRYSEGGLLEYVGSGQEDIEINGKTIILSDIEARVRRCLGRGVDAIIEPIAFKGHRAGPTLAVFLELGTLFQGSEDLLQLSTTTKERVYIARQLVEKTLRNTLSDDMIPSIFIPLKHLPMTHSLKVNRRKLQKLIQGLTKEQLLALATIANPEQVQSINLKPLPLTETETRVRALWARVLKVDEMSIYATDSFLQVGGNHALAIEFVIAARREGCHISIADVLRHASLTELCRAMTAVEDMQVSEESLSPMSSPPISEPTNTVSKAFVERVIVPKMNIQARDIQDVADASDMQIRSLESGMLHRAGIDHFIFSFSGSIQSKKLEEACQKLAGIHPILRTAFVPHGRKVYQVVLRNHVVEFKKYLCPSWKLTSLLEKTMKKDLCNPLVFDVPVTKFAFLDAGKQSILVLRLSKAQYDDNSIALLVRDLKKLYEAVAEPRRRPSYCDFVRYTQFSSTHGAEDYWRSLLHGAAVTQVVAHSKPPSLSSNVKSIQQQVSVVPLTNMGISFDTVLKAAWSMVLATLSGTSDVVFGELVEGRHVRLRDGHSASAVLGPTMNMVPVRVQFPGIPLSPLGLLQYVQAQRFAGIPFENVGLLSLIEKCTPWSYWTRMSTVVQHQHAETALSPEKKKTFHLGGSTCSFTMVESKTRDIPDLLVRSMARGATSVELSLTFSEDRVPESFAYKTMNMLAGMITMLTSVNMMQPIIPTADQFAFSRRQIPLAEASHDAVAVTGAQEQHRLQLEMMIPPDQAFILQSFIADAWEAVLNIRALGVPEQHMHNAAFYDLWGSLIPAAQLASHLTREVQNLELADVEVLSIKISMDEVIDHPTMLRQFELLARKIYKEASSTIQEDSPTSSAAFAKRKSLVVGTTIGKGIRRLASNVVRVSPLARTPTLSSPTAVIPEVVSPISPSSHEVPQLPDLPLLSPVSVHAPPVLVHSPPVKSESVETRQRSGTSGSQSSMGSMTEGSSASSSSAATSDGGEEDSPQVAMNVASQGLVIVTKLEPEGPREEDIVSPLSPVGGRLFDGLGLSGAAVAKRRMSAVFGMSNLKRAERTSHVSPV